MLMSNVNSEANQQPKSFQFQPQHSDGSVFALILGLVDAGFPGGLESAFLHHSAGGGIVNEMPADERLDVRRSADIV